MLGEDSAYKYILRETRRIKWIPFDNVNLERLREIGRWYKEEDEETKKVLFASINAEHERWTNVSPILMLVVPVVTIFFTFLISFSLGLLNIGSNLILNKSSLSDDVLKELDLKDTSADIFLNELLTSNMEDFLSFLLTFIVILIFLLLAYYWKFNRLSKMKNIIEIYSSKPY